MRPARLVPPLLTGLVVVVVLVGVALVVLHDKPAPDARPSAHPTGAASSRPVEPSSGEGARVLYVSRNAAPPGEGSARHPFPTIQQGLAAAQPGDTVTVGPGTYREAIRSVRSGTRNAPIRLLGRHAVITGKADQRLVELTHDDVVVQGFEITGGNKLVWIVGAHRVRLLHNWLHDAGGECVRLRYRAGSNEIAWNRIEHCGRSGFDPDRDSKNGEGIYIGTAPEQLDENPTDEPDTSGRNWIHNNDINVPAECVDVKEHAQRNVIENNTCTGGEDSQSAGLSSRGLGTVLRDNRSHGNVGSGIRLGGDQDDDGVDSVVRGNQVWDNGEFGIEILTTPQAAICENQTHGNEKGPTNVGNVDIQGRCSA